MTIRGCTSVGRDKAPPFPATKACNALLIQAYEYILAKLQNKRLSLCLCASVVKKIILETGNSSDQAVRLQCLAIVNGNFTTINTDDTLSPEVFNNP